MLLVSGGCGPIDLKLYRISKTKSRKIQHSTKPTSLEGFTTKDGPSWAQRQRRMQAVANKFYVLEGRYEVYQTWNYAADAEATILV